MTNPMYHWGQCSRLKGVTSGVLDIQRLRAEPEAVKATAARWGEDPGLLDEVIALDERQRAAGRRADELRAEVKRISREVGALHGAIKASARLLDYFVGCRCGGVGKG